mmetsp:Transcript_45023/g.106994  ORF Transcript_45023/g.106994 Transcript_45023/m.106994 type:complete len:320 (+) Transcript_45023:337-1296(+)
MSQTDARARSGTGGARVAARARAPGRSWRAGGRGVAWRGGPRGVEAADMAQCRGIAEEMASMGRAADSMGRAAARSAETKTAKRGEGDAPRSPVRSGMRVWARGGGSMWSGRISPRSRRDTGAVGRGVGMEEVRTVGVTRAWESVPCQPLKAARRTLRSWCARSRRISMRWVQSHRNWGFFAESFASRSTASSLSSRTATEQSACRSCGQSAKLSAACVPQVAVHCARAAKARDAASPSPCCATEARPQRTTGLAMTRHARASWSWSSARSTLIIATLPSKSIPWARSRSTACHADSAASPPLRAQPTDTFWCCPAIVV